KQVIGLAFSPAADAVAAAVEGGGVYLWNLAAGGTAPIEMDSSASDKAKNLYFAPDGRSVTWLGTNGLRTYDRDARSIVEVRRAAGCCLRPPRSPGWSGPKPSPSPRTAPGWWPSRR